MKKKILVLGAGALGSQLVASLLPDLRGEAEITVLDFDEIESRNIEAATQFFLREQIGMKKTEALQYNLYKWFGWKIEIINGKLTPRNLSLLRGFDLLVDTFDNMQARKITQAFFLQAKVDCLHCGFSPSMTFEACWAENYKVPSDIPTDFDICDMPGAASFVRLAAAVGANAVLTYIQKGEKKGFVGNRFSVREVK